MKSFGAFLGKELREIVGTWRIWVVPGMVLFFALTSPLIALATPALVSSLAGSQPGVSIQLPDPVARDAYLQFVKNLDQLVTFALIISGAGAISGERRSGTAQLVLTKPLSRAAFVAAKVASQVILVVLAAVVGAVVCAIVTASLFEGSQASSVFAATAWWLVFAILLVGVMTLCSASFTSTGGAAGAGLAFFFLTLILRPWGLVASHSFVGLPALGYAAARGMPATGAGWLLATGAAAFAMAVGLAIVVFRRAEL